MQTTLTLATFVFGALGVVTDSTVLGQARETRQLRGERRAQSEPDIRQFWDPAKIMEVAVNNLAKRYVLNAEQKAFTNDMMTTRVTKFLEEHQDEIWPLLRELVYHQRTGEAPKPDIARELGPRVLKIIEEAKAEILQSNTEWREILTDEQKKVHDFDLEQMGKTFAAMEQNFTQWSDGAAQQTNIFPPPPKGVQQPPRPGKPKEGLSPDEQPIRLVSHFEEYVVQFIKDYQLTADQTETAYSILREIQGRAKNYEQSKAKEFAAVKEKLSARDMKERKAATLEKRRLTAPIDDLFTLMKTRLDLVPDTAQKERYQSQDKARRSAAMGSKGAAPKPGPTKTVKAGSSDKADGS